MSLGRFDRFFFVMDLFFLWCLQEPCTPAGCHHPQGPLFASEWCRAESVTGNEALKDGPRVRGARACLLTGCRAGLGPGNAILESHSEMFLASLPR